MSRFNLTLALLVCLSMAYPVHSISRWFSASYADFSEVLKRYSHCYSYLEPLSSAKLNETEFLINQMKLFLNEANYENEQLLNISALMDNICRPEPDADYPISIHIDVNMFNNNVTGKENRCNAIDQALDSMFTVFKRASMNKSEPLDFSIIQYHPNPATQDSYNLTDLINTVWIKSETQIEHVCKITNSIKEYVQQHASNSTVQDRSQKPVGVFESFFEIIDRLFVEPMLGAQRRLYWGGSNSFESVYAAMVDQFGHVRNGIGSGIKGTRNYLSNMFSSSNQASKQSANKTQIVNANLTLATTANNVSKSVVKTNSTS